MAYQQTLDVLCRGRGTVEITDEVARIVRAAGVAVGLVHVFVQHTSCSVVLTENADPSVRRDLETLAARWAPDGDPAYRHDDEGDDDMAAHGRNILAGASVTVPIGNGEEHRHNFAGWGQGYGHVMLLDLHQRERTILLVVTHSQDVASRAQRVLYVNDGQVVQVEEQKLAVEQTWPERELVRAG